MAYDPAEGNFVFSDEELEKEIERQKLPANSMDPQEKHDIQRMFCTLLAQGSGINKAIQTINGSEGYAWGEHQRVSRKTIYAWRKFDPVFRDAWNECYAMGTERLEEKAQEFAELGNATLLVHMMKVRNPRRHAVHKTEISGPNGTPVAVTAIELIGVDAVDGQEAQPDDESPAETSS